MRRAHRDKSDRIAPLCLLDGAVRQQVPLTPVPDRHGGARVAGGEGLRQTDRVGDDPVSLAGGQLTQLAEDGLNLIHDEADVVFRRDAPECPH